MPTARGAPRFPVEFDEDAFAEDLAHATPAAKAHALAARTRLAHGVCAVELRACQPQGRDGTALANCLKCYVPQPTGQWGIVWLLLAGPVRLAYLAFGERHPTRPGRPSVYQVADLRLRLLGENSREP